MQKHLFFGLLLLGIVVQSLVAVDETCVSYANEFKVNQASDAVSPFWEISPTSYDDWFFYFDNLTTQGVGASKIAKEYFEKHQVDLTPFAGAQGVWAAFYTHLPPPVFNQPNPVIEFKRSVQRHDRAELLYYIHGSGKIRVYRWNDRNRFEEILGGGTASWKTYNMTIDVNTFTIEMWANVTDGDFILVDVVYLTQCVLPTPPTPIAMPRNQSWEDYYDESSPEFV